MAKLARQFRDPAAHPRILRQHQMTGGFQPGQRLGNVIHVAVNIAGQLDDRGPRLGHAEIDPGCLQVLEPIEQMKVLIGEIGNWLQ